MFITTTMSPKEIIEVDYASYLDLKRWGLVLQENPTPASKPSKAPAEDTNMKEV